MTELAQRLYVGDGNCRYDPLPGAWTQSEPYRAAPELVEAVNVALFLRRPLLVEGDPGCGKTRLAYAIAYELGYPIKECYIRSTSRARDLLYTYDAVQRLYDMQERVPILRKAQKPRKDYIDLGSLGGAIELSEKGIPSVVLIDEIDKADIDFPNDLLLELDRLRFTVDEVKDYGFDAHREDKRRRHLWPLVIVTSNREKELPKPFLRRCLFYYIQFPNEKTLLEIIDAHFERGLTSLFEAALARFLDLRRQIDFQWRKIPSTSELLDWVQILEQAERDGDLAAQDLRRVPLGKLPHLETLVKTQSDLEALKNLDSPSD